jgi:hypothetical protein
MKTYAEYREIVTEAIDIAASGASRTVYLVMENMRADHQHRMAALIDAINDMHMTYHGHGTSLLMCPVHPCNTVHDIVKGDRY